MPTPLNRQTLASQLGAAVALAAVAGGLLTGCGTSRVVEYPYAKVAAAARERFVRIYPGGYYAKNAEVSEDPTKPRLDVFFNEIIDYEHAIETEVQVTGLDAGHTRIEATVTKNLRSWFMRWRSEDLEAAFLDVFAERLRTGKWPPFPWMTKKAVPEGGAAPPRLPAPDKPITP
jgi:hypothetical protein